MQLPSHVPCMSRNQVNKAVDWTIIHEVEAWFVFLQKVGWKNHACSFCLAQTCRQNENINWRKRIQIFLSLRLNSVLVKKAAPSIADHIKGSFIEDECTFQRPCTQRIELRLQMTVKMRYDLSEVVNNSIQEWEYLFRGRYPWGGDWYTGQNCNQARPSERTVWFRDYSDSKVYIL